MVCSDIISMIICAMLVLFAMSAAELMKKRSGVCSANIQSIKSSQRSHIRASAKDGQCLQLPFSLLCTSSHNINKFENKQMNAQARTPAAVPSAPEGSCVMLARLLEWASAVSEPGSSGKRKKCNRDVKTSKRQRSIRQERGRKCRSSHAESGPVLLILSARRNAMEHPSGVCVWPTLAVRE